MAARPDGHAAVVDLYLSWPGEQRAPEETRDELIALVGALPFAADVRRIAVAVCPGGGNPVNYFTLRPETGADGATTMVEDDLVRGIHPMVGRRLSLWRLRDFDVTRLEAPEDVLLYHCVAQEQPGRQAPRRAGPGAPAGRRTRRATAPSPPSRTPSGRWRTASRRSGGRAPSGAPPGPRST